jgi:hypothetical protein
MYVVFQTETGGDIAFSAQIVPAAVSGYVDAVSKDRKMYRFDGAVVSGFLFVPRSGLANVLMPDQYVLLPQVVDAESRVYFLETTDVQIVEVPSFFENVLLMPGSSVLVRLNNVESLLSLLVNAGVNSDGTIGVTPSGLATGDLSGFYPNPTVSRLQGVPVMTGIPDLNDVLTYVDGEWVAALVKQDATYRYIQATPATSWMINHNLGKRPSVSVHDTAGSVMFGSVTYMDDNTLCVFFSTAVSGEAECN